MAEKLTFKTKHLLKIIALHKTEFSESFTLACIVSEVEWMSNYKVIVILIHVETLKQYTETK